MPKKRPCSVCRRWFEPKPRAVRHQRTCGPECRRELHRRQCAQWHERNPDYDRKERLRRRLVREPEEAAGVDPLRALDWDAVQAAVGVETQVVIEEATRLSVAVARDTVATRMASGTAKEARLRSLGARDAVATRTPSPSGNSDRLPPSEPREAVGPGGPAP